MLFISYQNTESENGQRINDRENEKKERNHNETKKVFFTQLQSRLFVHM